MDMNTFFFRLRNKIGQWVKIYILDQVGFWNKIRLIIGIASAPDLHQNMVKPIEGGELEHLIDLLRVGHGISNHPKISPIKLTPLSCNRRFYTKKKGNDNRCPYLDFFGRFDQESIRMLQPLLLLLHH